MHPGGYGSGGDGPKGVDRPVGRQPRERAIVEGVVARPETAGFNNRPQAGRGGRGVGFLEGHGPGVRRNAQQRCWVHNTANVLTTFPRAFRNKPRNGSSHLAEVNEGVKFKDGIRVEKKAA